MKGSLGVVLPWTASSLGNGRTIELDSFQRRLQTGARWRVANFRVRMLRWASCMPSLSYSMHGRSTYVSESE